MSIGRFRIVERAEPRVVEREPVGGAAVAVEDEPKPSPVEINETSGSGLEIWSKPNAAILSYGRDMGTTGEWGYVKFRTDRLLPAGEVWRGYKFRVGNDDFVIDLRPDRRFAIVVRRSELR